VIKFIDMASIKFLKSEFTWCHIDESKRKVRDRALALR